MIKVAKVLGYINLAILSLMGAFFIQFLIDSASGNGWALLGLVIIGLMFSIVSFILTIPFIIIIIKIGYNTAKLYSYTHTAMLVLSIAMFLIGTLMS